MLTKKKLSEQVQAAEKRTLEAERIAVGAGAVATGAILMGTVATVAAVSANRKANVTGKAVMNMSSSVDELNKKFDDFMAY